MAAMLSAAAQTVRAHPDTDDFDSGLARMKASAAAFVELGVALQSFDATLLGQAYLRTLRFEDGLHVIDQALAELALTEDRWCEAELHRVRGELLVVSADELEAEASLWRAIDLTRRQGAKALELRATHSLARLWRAQGHLSDARELLGPAIGWFDEGLDTADLVEAHALLAGLR
jgi:tetratricopeptide (TPR) repeat protein